MSQVKLSLKTVDCSFISYTIDGTFPTAFLGIRNEGFQDDYTMINIDESCILRVIKKVFRLFPINRILRKATCSKGKLLLKINWILHIYKEPQDQKTLFNTIFNFNKTKIFSIICKAVPDHNHDQSWSNYQFEMNVVRMNYFHFVYLFI